MMGDLVTHQLRLFDDFSGKRAIFLTRFVGDDAERRLERMGEIADMGARPVDDLAVGLDQGIELLLERPDLGGKFAPEPLRIARADRSKVMADGAERREAEADLEQRRHHEPEPEHAECSNQHHAELAEVAFDLGRIAGDGVGIGSGLSACRPDLALDHAQALVLRARRVGAPCQGLVGRDALLARQLQLLVEQRSLR